MNNLKALIEKYETAGPRYTSYPTAPHFSVDTNKEKLAKLALASDSPLSLYIHIPFCKTLCWFCGCTSSVCNNSSLVDNYIDLLQKELELWRDKGLTKRTLKQIHFGGGTPNFLTVEQILRVGNLIEKYFVIDADCEFSVELDPRTLTKEKTEAFVKIGINRASIGVQDTNPEVQKAINRIQPQEKNLLAVTWLREAGVKEINIDLIYGLPLQTLKTFSKTLEDAMSLEPTRLALFGYAHVPWMKPSQKNLEKLGLPSANEKVDLFISAKNFFESNGFEYVGLDHFAKPDDALIKARKNGTLHRNFQGYSTRAGLDGFAIGLTSISETKTSYRQNFKIMDDYKASIENGNLPIERGIILNGDDILRRGIIMDVMCSLKVNYQNYGVDFRKMFESAFPKLAEMESDGLVELSENSFSVTDKGRLFLRNIAMLFDGRLSQNAQRYSKTI